MMSRRRHLLVEHVLPMALVLVWAAVYIPLMLWSPVAGMVMAAVTGLTLGAILGREQRRARSASTPAPDTGAS